MKRTTKKQIAARELGRLGGKVKSDAKKRSAKENGKKGGRPRIIRETY